MTDSRQKVKRLLLPAFVGTVALEAILLFSAGSRDIFSARELPTHLLAVVVGTLGGWIFEIFKDLLAAAEDSFRQVEVLRSSVSALAAKIKYQDSALEMLAECPRHNVALSELIKASMSDNFRNIPFVTLADYLRILELSIEHSKGYQGVQRHSLRWYRDQDAGGYLESLKDKPMDYKTRLFVLDEPAQREMVEDLSNPSVVDYYWRHTGSVDSLWVSEADFKKNFPQIPLPQDFALYDGALLIMYDEDRQILSFDVVGEASTQTRIFRDLNQLAQRHADSAFKRIPDSAYPDERRVATGDAAAAR